MSIERRMSPHMERIAKQMAARYGIDWREKGAHLMLARAGRPERWLLIHLDSERFSLTCCLTEPAETLVPEVDMVFALHAEGWEPIELLYSQEAFTSYVQAAKAANLSVYDNEGNLRFDTFTEYWAKQLEEQGWLQYGYRLPEQESCGRLSGCQRTSHTACYGELWQCSNCHRTFCYAEGTDNHPELCDECWAARFAPEVVGDRSKITFTKEGTLDLSCDCPEQCGTWLKLTADGVLALEDKDGLRVSMLLPDWLEDAIRQAVVMQQAAMQKSYQETLND
jgi:hypothetical protein